VPEVSAKLKEPNTKERKFEDVVKSAEQAACWCWCIDGAKGANKRTAETR